MTPDFSPFSYTLNNPVNFIDEFGLSGSGWNTRGREKTDADLAMEEMTQQSENVSFIQGGFRDVMTQSGSGKVGGANNGNENESWYQKGMSFVSGVVDGVGDLMESMAPIRILKPGETTPSLPEIWNGLISAPATISNIYKTGDTYQKTRVTVSLLGLVKGKSPKAALNVMKSGTAASSKAMAAIATTKKIHGNSLKSTKPTWGYKLFSNDGTFLKNGITSKIIPEKRYSKSYMLDKFMKPTPFSNRLKAYEWESLENQILRGPLNKNMH